MFHSQNTASNAIQAHASHLPSSSTITHTQLTHNITPAFTHLQHIKFVQHLSPFIMINTNTRNHSQHNIHFFSMRQWNFHATILHHVMTTTFILHHKIHFFSIRQWNFLATILHHIYFLHYPYKCHSTPNLQPFLLNNNHNGLQSYR